MDVQVPVAKAIPPEPIGMPPSSSFKKAPNTAYARPRYDPYAKSASASASKPVKATTCHAPTKPKCNTPTQPPVAPTPDQEWAAIKNACEQFCVDGSELAEPLIVAVKGESLSADTIGHLDKVTLAQLDQLKNNVFYPVANVTLGGAPVFKSARCLVLVLLCRWQGFWMVLDDRAFHKACIG